MVDHLNGCRTPLMDGSRTGAVHGLTLNTTPAQLYRAAAEGTAMGCRRIVDLLETHGLPIDQCVATGGLAHNPFYRQVLADVLQREIEVHPAGNGPAIGAAVFGACASGEFETVAEAAETLASLPPGECRTMVTPNHQLGHLYSDMHQRYLSRAGGLQSELLQPQRRSMCSPAYTTSTGTQPAAFIHSARDLRVETIPMPTPKLDEVLLDVEVVGICGSDLHYYKDGGIGSDVIAAPFVPGHEFSAVLRSDVDGLGAAGTRVVVDPGVECQQCEWCVAGHTNLCASMRFIGAPPYNGALQPTICVPRRNVYPVPVSMTATQVCARFAEVPLFPARYTF